MTQYPRQPHTPCGTRFLDEDFPPEAIKEFGSPTEGSYLLTYWRGEWEEYYASWVMKSSLVFEPKSYHVLGSGVVDDVVAVFVGVILLFLAARLWPRRGVPKKDYVD